MKSIFQILFIQMTDNFYCVHFAGFSFRFSRLRLTSKKNKCNKDSQGKLMFNNARCIIQLKKAHKDNAESWPCE